MRVSVEEPEERMCTEGELGSGEGGSHSPVLAYSAKVTSSVFGLEGCQILHPAPLMMELREQEVKATLREMG